MPTPTTQPKFQDNQLVTAANLLAMEEGARTLAGTAAAAFLGTASYNSMDYPFTATVSTMSVTAGGSGGQKILIQGPNGPRIVDNVPIQSFTVPTADATNPRHDLIVAAYNNVQIAASPSTGSFETISGGVATTSTGPVYNSQESLTYTYVTGTAASSPADPSLPAGTVALVRVTVPAAAVSLTSANLTVLLPTMQATILGGLSGYVDLTNNQSVAGNKTFTGTTIAGGMTLVHTDAALSVPAIRLNLVNSVLISSQGPGHTVSLGYEDLGLLGVYFGPQNTWGFVGPLGYTAGDGTTFAYGQNANIRNGQLHVGSSNTTFGTVGDIIAERGNSKGVVYLGNTANAYLYFDGANYNLPNGPVVAQGFQYGTTGNSIISGIVVPAALTFPNAAGTTSIGSNGVMVSGVAANALSATYSATGQTVLSIDNSGSLGVLHNISTGGSFVIGGTLIGASGTPINGVPGNAVLISNNGNAILALDTLGDVGIPGALFTGQNSRGISLNAPGAVLVGNGLTTSTLTVNGSSTFNSPLVVTGSNSIQAPYVTAKNGTGISAYVPPVYTSNGNSASNTVKIVQGQIAVNSGVVTSVSLAGAAVFGNSSTYTVTASSDATGGYFAVQIQRINGSTFTVQCNQTCTIMWIAIGS